jgi:hypothetical protein
MQYRVRVAAYELSKSEVKEFWNHDGIVYAPSVVLPDVPLLTKSSDPVSLRFSEMKLQRRVDQAFKEPIFLKPVTYITLHAIVS